MIFKMDFIRKIILFLLSILFRAFSCFFVATLCAAFAFSASLRCKQNYPVTNKSGSLRRKPRNNASH